MNGWVSGCCCKTVEINEWLGVRLLCKTVEISEQLGVRLLL